MPRVLFVIRDLPRARISIAAMLRGEEPLSGTHGSLLLVAEGLARRGYDVGITAMNGSEVTDGLVSSIPNLEEAVGWSRPGACVIWACCGEDRVLEQINALGVQPLVWLHVDSLGQANSWLAAGRITAILTNSDTMRAGSFRVMISRRIGRVYNPLSPIFSTDSRGGGVARFRNPRVVFTGYIGGAARVLEMWPYVRRTLPEATLILAGSERLYGDWRELGALGIADASFEIRSIGPLALEFGSLENAGVTFAGLVPPFDLIDLYRHCALGLVNFTWDQSEGPEMFCCAAVEMLATGLPVFSVARGALPETIGRSRGAVLSRHRDLELTSRELVQLLGEPQRLAALAERGAAFVKTHYAWESILSQWEHIIHAPSNSFHRLSGKWHGPQTLRSSLGRTAAVLGVEPLLLHLNRLAKVLTAGGSGDS